MESSRHEYFPSLVFIEATSACDYACRHCRADSQTEPDENDLKMYEIQDLLNDLGNLSQRPEIVITGGNPLLRNDIRSIISAVHDSGFDFSLSPAASGLLTDDFLSFVSDLGIRSISLSLDGQKGKSHDWLRNSAWSYDKTMELIKRIKDFDIASQINTTVFEKNVMELPYVAKIVRDMDLSAWEVFFLIKTGRASLLDDISASDYMQIVNWLRDLREYGINVRTVEAPVFRVIESIRRISPQILMGRTYDRLKAKTFELMKTGEKKVPEEKKNEGTIARRFTGTLFISHEGKVYLSGLIPYELGSIRNESIHAILSRNSPFLNYRYGNLLEGKCGECNFKRICGGSRARAYSVSGDPYAQDPNCLYNPKEVKLGMSQLAVN